MIFIEIRVLDKNDDYIQANGNSYMLIFSSYRFEIMVCHKCGKYYSVGKIPSL